jgi:hypothetical protein
MGSAAKDQQKAKQPISPSCRLLVKQEICAYHKQPKAYEFERSFEIKNIGYSFRTHVALPEMIMGEAWHRLVTSE